MAGHNLGLVITRLRKERGMTRYRLARESGVSYSYLVGIEEGKHSPSMNIALKIAAALGVTVAELIGEGEVHAQNK